MIMIGVNSDGGNTEGIGAMVQAQLMCYTIAKKNNLEYFFSKFRNFTHFQHFGSSQEKFMEEVNDFFVFPTSTQEKEITRRISLNHFDKKQIEHIRNNSNKNEKILLEFNLKSIAKHFTENNLIHYAEKESTIRSLSSGLDSRRQFRKTVSDNEHKKICIHIRKRTHTDTCAAPIRDYFTPNKKMYYEKVVKSLSMKYEDVEAVIEIVAQGNIEDYEFLKSVSISGRHKIEFYVEDHPLKSLFQLINADVLMMSNSSFSWISHLYGAHELVCVKDSFNHPMYSANITRVRKDGEILWKQSQ